MNVLEVRSKIEGLLGDRVGTFSDGTSAVWVEPPVPNVRLRVTGLHVVIFRFPILRGQQHGLVQNVRIQDWRVTLRQYDISRQGLSIFDESIDLIRKGFPLLSERVLESEEDLYPQVTFMIQDSQILNRLVGAA